MSKQRVVIVTGGGGGIGSAICQKFAQQGDQVVVGQRKDTTNQEYVFFPTDLSQAADCEKLIEQTFQQFGRIDVLINNAGVMRQHSVENTPMETWDQTIAVNLRAPFLLTKYAVKHLRESEGSIINIGSIEGLGSNPNHSAYCASKAGLEGLTRATTVDHGDKIRCNTIAPGWIDTALNQEFVDSMPNSKDFKQRLSEIHPSGRIGQPVDIANVAYFLCSDEASFICGQTITVDGGRTIQLPLP